MTKDRPIKEIMKANRVAQWEVAKTIGMNESVFSRKLRDEPEGEFRKQIIEAIKTIKAQSLLVL